MAYAASITVTPMRVAGRRHWILKVSETDLGAADEWSTVDDLAAGEVLDLPHLCTVTHLQTDLTSGTGTTVQPSAGKVTGWTADTNDEAYTTAAPAAVINDGTRVPITFDPTVRPNLFGNTGVDAGTDNVSETILVIAEGHDE